MNCKNSPPAKQRVDVGCKMVTAVGGLGGLAPSGWRGLAIISVSQEQGRAPAAQESPN